jgi:dienelactone hydrolase
MTRGWFRAGAGLLLALLVAAPAAAKPRTEVVRYRHGDVALEGHLGFDDARRGRRPAVLVVHDWTGINVETRRRVDLLVQLGYVAFAVDMYGAGVRPATGEAAQAEAARYKRDRPLMRARARAGLDWLARHPRVDPARIAVIGYCFGGTTALELARSGAPVAATVSFHGNLDTPAPDDARRITGKVLVLHGADDPVVPPSELAAFQQEMRAAGVDWTLISYGGAVHGFTDQRRRGAPPGKSPAYHERADRRSWEAMRALFTELFGGPPGRAGASVEARGDGRGSIGLPGAAR